MKVERIKIHTNKHSLVEESYISDFSDMEFCDPTDDAFDDEVIDPENYLRRNEDIFTFNLCTSTED